MNRFLVKTALALGVVFGLVGGLSDPAAAVIADDKEAMAEMAIGADDAPVTMIEYSSLGCPHCASFHRDALPRLKKEYIDTGKVRLIYRDFPLGSPALAASMIARCAGKDRYFGFVELLFRSQKDWSRGDNPLEALTRVARFGGMSATDVQACLKNQALLDRMQEVARDAQFDHEINSTPSFILDGKKISGNLAYEDFKDLIEQALKKAQ